MLGPLVDPLKDCKLTKDDETMKITLEVPGGKVRTLAPYVTNRDNRQIPLHNAPMVLAELEGNFVAVVEVTGEMAPGSTLPQDRQGNEIPFTFQGAGLLLYQDKDNFVRLERTAGVVVDTLQPVRKVLFEVVKDGKQLNNNYLLAGDGDVYLMLIRQKSKVFCAYTSNISGGVPRPVQYVELDLPKKVKIGLSAANISAKPYNVTFENFALITDETQIQALYGEIEMPKQTPGEAELKTD